MERERRPEICGEREKSSHPESERGVTQHSASPPADYKHISDTRKTCKRTVELSRAQSVELGPNKMDTVLSHQILELFKIQNGNSKD